MLRYALLRHECPPDYRDGPHWDLMLERAGVDAERRLATWSLLTLPSGWPEAMDREAASEPEPLATALEDHRAAYLGYEGPVSGNRGVVSRWSGGPLEWIVEEPDRIEVALRPPSPLVGVVRMLPEDASDVWRVGWSVAKC